MDERVDIGEVGPATQQAPDPATEPPTAPAAEASGLGYVYGDGSIALKDVDLRIDAGQKVALLGPNGAGKSTLLQHLNGTLMGSGRLRVFGMDINRGTLPEVRRKVGLVFQDPDDQLFLPTVFEDVAFGPLNQGFEPLEAEHRVTHALEAVGMAWAAGKSVGALSFGEKKRVALATVLSMDPDILALDEPTSNLDRRARQGLSAILSVFPKTLVLATHDMDFAWAMCDRAVIMEKGTIAADGPCHEVLRDGGLLEGHGLDLPFAARR